MGVVGCANAFQLYAEARTGEPGRLFDMPIDVMKDMVVSIEYTGFQGHLKGWDFRPSGDNTFKMDGRPCVLSLTPVGDKTRVLASCRYSGLNGSIGPVDEDSIMSSIGKAVAKARLSYRAQASPPPTIDKEQLNTVVQAAVKGAMGARNDGVPVKSITSDIDKPAYRLAERPGDFAIVVGIGKYSDIPEAQFAERDAEAVKDHLIAAGFPSRNVIQLFGEKAGRSAMEKFLETWLPRNVGEDSRVFFYFSGHGAPDPRTGEAYLIPWDGDPGFLENTGYPIRRLYEKLSGLRVREVIVVMDACFSGAGGRSVLAKGARPLVMKVDTAGVPQNLTVFAAASGDQITSTLDDQGHGTFTYYFLRGLSGAAKDASGRVTTKALYDYLKPKVQDAARRQNRDQEPVLHGQGDRELIRF
jgi:uncharacterized caspase-like protein